MPAVGRSYYTDMHCGMKYWSFISEELPAIAESLFPISSQREHTFAAGLSMGGYGAFKLALSKPGKFCAAASLSGALDPDALYKIMPSLLFEYRNIFGYQPLKGSANDLFALSRDLARTDGPTPRLFQCCGTEDFLYQDNQIFKRHLESLGFDLTYTEGPGSHDWGYWDSQIQKVLNWLPLTPSSHASRQSSD
jgi:S-formylglutathione hydrolase FrmB